MIDLDKLTEYVKEQKCNRLSCFGKGAGVAIAMEPNTSGSVLTPKYVVLCREHMGPGEVQGVGPKDAPNG